MNKHTVSHANVAFFSVAYDLPPGDPQNDVAAHDNLRQPVFGEGVAQGEDGTHYFCEWEKQGMIDHLLASDVRVGWNCGNQLRALGGASLFADDPICDLQKAFLTIHPHSSGELWEGLCESCNGNRSEVSLSRELAPSDGFLFCLMEVQFLARIHKGIATNGEWCGREFDTSEHPAWG